MPIPLTPNYDILGVPFSQGVLRKMKLWDVIKVGSMSMITLGGLALSVVPAIKSVTQVQQGMLGLEWEWWSIIGVCVVTLTLGIIILQLWLKLRDATSEEAVIRREKLREEIKSLKASQPETIQTVGQNHTAEKSVE